MLLHALACSIALAAPALSASPDNRAADGQARSLQQSARRVIDKASSWTEGAIDWCARKGGDLKGVAEGWRVGAGERLRAAVDGALEYPAPPTGVRLLTGGPDASGRLAWEALDAAHGAAPGSVVLLVHGLDEPGSVWDELAPLLQRAGRSVARFDYADDQACAISADELAGALAGLRARGVQRVDIVAHSMGGLIARDVLTREAYYAGDGAGGRGYPPIGRLIMLGTPNHGSVLARLRFIGEAREHLVRWFESEGRDPRALLGFLKDGGGEAGDDLAPGSPYLSKLNARALPRGVLITNVIGVMGDGAAESLVEMLGSGWIRRVLPQAEIDRAERAVAEASGVLGDGIVSAGSASLEGVSDTVRVGAAHRTMVRRPAVEGLVRGEPRRMPSGVPVILDRLGVEAR